MIRPAKVLLVCGARPNFMKVAPLHAQMSGKPCFDVRLVHTGQHYDRAMSDVFFEQLGLPVPDIALGVGSGTHGSQTAEVLERFERVLCEERPSAVVVVGDVNSTMACALATVKAYEANGARPLLAHVEAGLRSRDRTMPEEINRIVTDAVSDLLFTTEEAADRNLLAEGIPETRIHFVGNVMIDCLAAMRPVIESKEAWRSLGLSRGAYGVVTLHRPSNVDSPDRLMALMRALERISRRLPLVFPIHPRTLARVPDGRPADHVIRFLEPLPYVDFLSLVGGSRLVITDSGGLQEETTSLGIPCLTVRENTERPVTIERGTNRLVGTTPAALEREVGKCLAAPPRSSMAPPLWDGKAAERISYILERALCDAPRTAAPA